MKVAGSTVAVTDAPTDRYCGGTLLRAMARFDSEVASAGSWGAMIEITAAAVLGSPDPSAGWIVRSVLAEYCLAGRKAAAPPTTTQRINAATATARFRRT